MMQSYTDSGRDWTLARELESFHDWLFIIDDSSVVRSKSSCFGGRSAVNNCHPQAQCEMINFQVNYTGPSPSPVMILGTKTWKRFPSRQVSCGDCTVTTWFRKYSGNTCSQNHWRAQQIWTSIRLVNSNTKRQRRAPQDELEFLAGASKIKPEK